VRHSEAFYGMHQNMLLSEDNDVSLNRAQKWLWHHLAADAQPRATNSGLSAKDSTPYLDCVENKWPGTEDGVSRTCVSMDT
jgi:hypothetical protein